MHVHVSQAPNVRRDMFPDHGPRTRRKTKRLRPAGAPRTGTTSSRARVELWMMPTARRKIICTSTSASPDAGSFEEGRVGVGLQIKIRRTYSYPRPGGGHARHLGGHNAHPRTRGTADRGPGVCKIPSRHDVTYRTAPSRRVMAAAAAAAAMAGADISGVL